MGRAALLLLLLLVAATADAADWVRIDTPNFVVYGQVGESRTREIASQFERFREALGRVVPGAATRAAVPSVVVIFDTRKAFAPYRPVFNGKAVDVAGYFQGNEYENLVALAAEGRTDGLRVIFHEYTHLAVANVTPHLPAWVSEGLAEFYSTFSVSDDGREATLGAPIASHVELMANTSLMPMQELLSVTHDSPLYNEGQRRSLFYAQSWALVHYLMLEEPSRGASLGRYVSLVSSGTDAAAAWKQVFGDADLVPALKRYATRSRVNGLIYKFSAGIEKTSGVAVKVQPAEIEAVLGDLLQWTSNSWIEADARFAAAMKMGQPGRAQALVGLARVRREDREDPIAPLMAATSDPDWLTQYYVAIGLSRSIDQASAAQRADVIAAANRALDVVQAVRPDLPHAMMVRADVALRADQDLPAALTSIRRARAGAPGRDDYAFLEAAILTRQGAFAAARDVLGPLMSPATSPQIRERARGMMGLVVSAERAEAERAERSARSLRELAPAPGMPRPTDVIPAYRIMKGNEQRTEGLLEQIQCSQRSVTIDLRADGRVLHYTAPSMSVIEFISYRDDLAGSVTCGRREPPDPVYVTWTPLADSKTTLGRVVAIEFVKK